MKTLPPNNTNCKLQASVSERRRHDAGTRTRRVPAIAIGPFRTWPDLVPWQRTAPRASRHAPRRSIIRGRAVGRLLADHSRAAVSRRYVFSLIRQT
ncbi:unnamed protein product, partial [Iphiclides podalirius]